MRLSCGPQFIEAVHDRGGSNHLEVTIDSTMTQARSTCPECGAPVVDGLTCWEQLGLLIAWEFQDPELQAEHFLTVSAYNLQHPAQFTDEALAGFRAMFVEHLDNGLHVKEIRRRVGKAAVGNTRVLKDESERRPVLHSRGA